MRRRIVLLAVVLICVFTSWIVGRSNPPATSQATARRVEIDAGMDRVIANVDFHDVPLNKVIESLRDQTKTNLVADWEVLEAAGIDRAMPISCRLTNVPLWRVLDVVAELTSPTHGRVGAEARGGVIEFTTSESLSQPTETRIFNVRDLIESHYELHQKWNLAPPSDRQSSQSTTAPSYRPTYDQAIDALKQLITDTVAPDAWRSAGGTVGSITEFNGLLIITGTSQILNEIDDLLAKIRKEG